MQKPLQKTAFILAVGKSGVSQPLQKTAFILAAKKSGIFCHLSKTLFILSAGNYQRLQKNGFIFGGGKIGNSQWLSKTLFILPLRKYWSGGGNFLSSSKTLFILLLGNCRRGDRHSLFLQENGFLFGGGKSSERRSPFSAPSRNGFILAVENRRGFPMAQKSRT